MSVNTKHSRRLSREERDRLALQRAKHKLITAWVGTVILMIFMVPMWLRAYQIGGRIFSFTVLFIVSAWIVFVSGSEVLKSAWISAKHFSPNMHVLTMMGTLAALLSGVLNLLWILDLFPKVGNFTALAGMIMAFHLTGSYIEQKLKRKSSNSIDSLISLSPKSACLVKGDKEISVPIDQLQIGDIVRIRTGDKVPSDGEIIEGNVDVDESLVTGESVPVFKEASQKVIGGSINIEGNALIRIEKVGKQTFLQQVIKLVQDAQGTKPKIQELSDRIITFFVPSILILALASFLIWILFHDSLNNFLTEYFSPLGFSLSDMNQSKLSIALFSAISVLVVACPCALGLATPSAIVTGIGKAAQLGTLIKNASVFEKLSNTDYIALDKTGTITEGTPKLVAIHTVKNFNEEDMLYMASVIEKTSRHPLAESVVKHYESKYNKRLDSPSSIQSLHGIGLFGTVDNSQIHVVNTRYIEEQKINVELEEQEVLDAYAKEGYTVSLVIQDGTIIGILAFVDEHREESPKAMDLLHRMGYKILMLTGDNEYAAERIAEKVGIDSVIARAQPDTKINTVENLQNDGFNVIMVGDGINDAPALTQAHVGVAMGSGTDIAAESGDVILIKATLSTLVSAIQLSRMTYRVIKQNLFWAFVYNLVLIPLSIIGLVHPLYAEIAMGISSICVLLNSMRLGRFSPKI